MPYFVICNNKFLHKASAVIGPFNTKVEATAWANEKDQYLTEDEFFDVHSQTDPTLIFYRTKAETGT